MDKSKLLLPAAIVTLAVSVLFVAGNHDNTLRCVAFYNTPGVIQALRKDQISPSRYKKTMKMAEAMQCRDKWTVKRRAGK